VTSGGATAGESASDPGAGASAWLGAAMTADQRKDALEAIAAEVRTCTRCRLSTTRTKAVPGEGRADTEVVFVGEGPGQNEDAQGRPFVGRAGELLVKWLASVGWRRQEVFITNIVKCRPPGNRDPEPDEIAACAPYLQRQLEVLDPAVVVTLGRFSMGHFRPGERITQIHGTAVTAPPETGARDAMAYALFHPAAALRSTDVERQSYDDIAGLPRVLREARARRSTGAARFSTPANTTGSASASTPATAAAVTAPAPAEVSEPAFLADAPPIDPGDDGPTLFEV
jgi:DNA polymerase